MMHCSFSTRLARRSLAQTFRDSNSNSNSKSSVHFLSSLYANVRLTSNLSISSHCMNAAQNFPSTSSSYNSRSSKSLLNFRAFSSNSSGSSNKNMIAAKSGGGGGGIGRKKANRKPSLQEILLSQVIQEESEMQTIDKEYEDMREIVLQKFEIVYEVESHSVVRLHREIMGDVIDIEFDVLDEGELNDNFDPRVDLKNMDFDEDSSEKNADGTKTGITFKVKISKKDPTNKSMLIITCIAASELAVSSISHVNDSTIYSANKWYNGPVLENLDDRLKSAIVAYLNERGIDEDLNYFIGSFSIYKEQREYVSWLKSHMAFVK